MVARKYDKNTRIFSMEDEMDSAVIWYLISYMLSRQDSQNQLMENVKQDRSTEILVADTCSSYKRYIRFQIFAQFAVWIDNEFSYNPRSARA